MSLDNFSFQFLFFTTPLTTNVVGISKPNTNIDEVVTLKVIKWQDKSRFKEGFVTVGFSMATNPPFCLKLNFIHSVCPFYFF
jgi:hypothetical protein